MKIPGGQGLKRMTDNIFHFTMSGLTAGLSVVHIAALHLMTCGIDQGIKDVLEDPALVGFDYIPVLNRKRIVGLVERRRTGDEGTVKEKMRPLDDSLLVSADEPLTSFVPCLRTNAFRLVVRGTEIRGIVTRSDLIKLPVRLVAFAKLSRPPVAGSSLAALQAQRRHRSCNSGTPLARGSRFGRLHTLRRGDTGYQRRI
jgi:predicted transcriptional regulator